MLQDNESQRIFSDLESHQSQRRDREMRSDSPANMADPEIEDVDDEEGEEESDDGFINTDFLDSRRESVKVVSVLNTQKEILLEKLARFHQDNKVSISL